MFLFTNLNKTGMHVYLEVHKRLDLPQTRPEVISPEVAVHRLNLALHHRRNGELVAEERKKPELVS
jgi:hypothetical protein